MNLEQQVMANMKDAMKAKDEAGLRGLRAIKAEIIKAKTEPGANGELTDEAAGKMLQKMMKQRKDSLEIFKAQKRDDLAQKEEEEIAVIEKFLPAQMSDEELRKALTEIKDEVGAVYTTDMGKVMGIATKQLAGKADGKKIAAMVREMLSANS